MPLHMHLRSSNISSGDSFSSMEGSVPIRSRDLKELRVSSARIKLTSRMPKSANSPGLSFIDKAFWNTSICAIVSELVLEERSRCHRRASSVRIP